MHFLCFSLTHTLSPTLNKVQIRKSYTPALFTEGNGHGEKRTTQTHTGTGTQRRTYRHESREGKHLRSSLTPRLNSRASLILPIASLSSLTIAFSLCKPKRGEAECMILPAQYALFLPHDCMFALFTTRSVIQVTYAALCSEDIINRPLGMPLLRPLWSSL